MNAYIQKENSKRIGLYSQIKNLIFQPKKLEKEEQIKPIANIKKKIINTKAEITETESRKAIENINKTKSWSFDINRSISRRQAD